ncbi:MAG TPA: hypothetical protein VF493_12980 [Terriglobales bacterium]
MLKKTLITLILTTALTMTAADAPGTGHLNLTGSQKISTDFKIDGCSIDKPGKGIMAGYLMNSTETDPMLTGLTLQIPSYTQDGVFRSEPPDANQKPRPVKFSAVARLQRSDPFGSPLQQTNATTLIATIRDRGKSGTLEMHNVTWLLTKSSPLSGTMTWTCPSVKTY